MQITYLSIVTSAYYTMLTSGYPLIPNPYMRSWHKDFGYVVFGICYWTFYKACTVSPGDLREETVERYDNYSYDNVLYIERVCKTTKFRKIARSKYDRTVGKQIPRFDHFCVWLNNVVGEENYRYFLLFIIVHFFMLSYGTLASWWCILYVVKRDNLWESTYYQNSTGENVKASWGIVVKYLGYHEIGLCGLLILTGVMGIVMFGFVIFHVYICATGRSTNEFFKWRDIQGWHKRARRRYDNTREEDRGPRFDISKAEYEMVGVDLNKDVGCVSVTSSTTSSSKNSEKEEALNDDEKEEADESNVQDPGPFPKNIYDRGVWGNFREVIWPRSLRESRGETKQKKTNGGGGSKKKKKKKKN